jgi:predicted esterase YcpF (UPF0227 family)
MNLLYLHGFNSDGGGFKYDRLRKAFKKAKVLSPDLPANPMEVIKIVDTLIAQQTGPTYCIGTSLGGFYAYYFSAKYNQPCFLFNPSLKPHATLHRGIGTWTTFQKERTYIFEEAYLADLKRLKEEAEKTIKEEHLNFFLATDDDILDLSDIPTLYPNANTLEWYDNTGHSFSRFPEALKKVKEILLTG